MQILKSFKHGIACATLMAVGLMNVNAQTTIWTGPASGGEWNTGANWNTGLVPVETTNVYIGIGTNINYNIPMTAGSFNILTNRGTINVNAGGFVIGGSGTPVLFYTTARMLINSGGAVSVTNGSVSLTTNSSITVATGGSFTAKNTVSVGQFGNSSTGGGAGFFTNSGGFVSLGGLVINNSGNNQNCIVQIIGGTNFLGNATVQRGNANPFGALGTEGLIISGGFVNMSSLNVGGIANNNLTTWVSGGVVTNSGQLQIHQATTGRGARFLQTGGYFVTTDSGLVTPNPLGLATGAATFSIFSVTGGTNQASGILCTSVVNTIIGSVLLTNGANIYLGSGGITTDGSVTVNSSLNNGGLYGAYADWTNAVASKINGASSSFTFRAADINGTAHNITVSGVISGGGLAATLNKTGAGMLTLDSAHTYLGTTLINEGTLTLAPGGSIASTPLIVGNGTVFDVSAVTGGYTVPANQTLAGLGTVSGAVAVASAGIINPGSNTVNGTLTFSSSITETGGATNHFDLIGTPGAGNDKVVIAGDYNASGLNFIDISGGANGNVYPLIQYGGNFNGDASVNLAVTGSPGVLSNNVATKTIYLISQNTARSPTNIVWIGNAVNNAWDVNTSTNWLLNGSLNHFMTGDNVLFDNTGAINPNVTLNTSVSPASTTVSSSSAYTLTGTGSIDGIGGSLTKDGSGTLSLQTVNTYTGPTTIKGGVLEVSLLANGGVNSAIGASVSDPSTLIVTNSTLRYTGDSVAIDRAANLGGSVTFDVTNSATTLAINGSLSGSATLTKNGAGGLTLGGANSYPGGVLLNAGTLTLNNASAAGSGAITFNGNTILGIGSFSPANTIVLSNYSGVIRGGNASTVCSIKNVIGSSNLVVAVTAGTFDLVGDMSTYSGTFTCSNAGGTFVRLNGSTGSKLATWDTGSGTSVLAVRNKSTTPYYFGALMGGPSSTLSGPTGSDSGGHGAATYQIGDNGLSTTFDGVIKNGSDVSQVLSIVKAGTGTLALSGANTFTGTTTVSNGVLALVNNPATSSDGSINNSATINLVSGAFLDVSARSDSTLQLGSSATQLLEGRGTLNGSLNTGGSGTVSPGGGLGGSVGTLKVTNSITLGGTAWMKLNRGASTNSDRLISSLSSITYGGTLVVTNVGAQLHATDTFTLFSGSGLGAATFGTVVLPNYYTWDTSQLGINGSVTVTGVLPPPAMTNVDFSNLSNGSITLNAVNGATNGLVIVQTTTDLSGTWTSISTNSFDGNGNFSQSVTVDPAAPQSFFRLLGL